MGELNNESIIKEIQKYILEGVPYIDAVCDYAERHEIEIEVLGELIRTSPVLKANIQAEAEELNMMERTPRLPI
jgi:hypothetical protein